MGDRMLERALLVELGHQLGSGLASGATDITPEQQQAMESVVDGLLVVAAERTGNDKTSIMFTTSDAPGALVRVLAAFEEAGVNLSHIDKRPSGRVNWDYTFFIDALGHREDESMRRAVDGARVHAKELTILGSYPRSTRSL